MSGTYSGYYHPDPSTFMPGQGTFAATKVMGGGGGKPPPPPQNANVEGTWTISTSPTDFSGGDVTWVFSAGIDPNVPGGLTTGTVKDSNGTEVAKYAVGPSAITITGTGSVTAVLTGTVKGNGMKGTFVDSATQNSGDWTAVEGIPTFSAAESMTQTAKLIAIDSAAKAIAVLNSGKFSISASIPVTPDNLASLDENSAFQLGFGQLTGAKSIFTLGTMGYTSGDKKVKYVYMDPNDDIPAAKATITYQLDWSNGTELKIKISGGFIEILVPNADGPFGASLLAINYVEQATEKFYNVNNQCTIVFGSQISTLNVSSTALVTTGKPLMAGSNSYEPSKVSVMSSIPKVKMGAERKKK